MSPINSTLTSELFYQPGSRFRQEFQEWRVAVIGIGPGKVPESALLKV
jgi:hypothetical protein